MSRAAVSRVIAAFATSATLTFSAPTVFGAPPPVPPRQAAEKVIALQKLFRSRDFSTLPAIFREDVKVTFNGVLIASTLEEFKPRLTVWVEGRATEIKLVSIDFENLLTIERMNTMGPEARRDCCVWSRSVLYELDDDYKVKAVHVLDPGSASTGLAAPPATAEQFPTLRPWNAQQ